MGNFLVFIEVWKTMDTIQGSSRRYFFTKNKLDPLESPPLWVSYYMTRTWFASVLYSFKYTNKETPPYKDTLYEVM